MDSIGDFAQNLILNQVEGIKEGKELPPSARDNGLTPAGRDISRVKVPDSFMTELLGEAYHSQDSPAVDEIPEIVWEQPEEPKAPQALTEETAQQLVPLLEEVKDLLKEMTSCGMMGANLGAPSKDDESWEKIEKSYGYKSPKTSKLPGDSRKKVLKNAIRAKLKKRK
jgi:hypothetical protein